MITQVKKKKLNIKVVSNLVLNFVWNFSADSESGFRFFKFALVFEIITYR